MRCSGHTLHLSGLDVDRYDKYDIIQLIYHKGETKMPFKDIREFIAKLEKEGEVQRIKEEVDWNLEAGAMLRRSYEASLPAPYFQRVKGYPEGYRLFGGTLSNHRRIAIAMDLDPHTPVKELIEEYLRRKQRAIKPILVNHGPCKENIHIGDEVDLLEFPVPMIHEGDGGRYIGTWHLAVSKDLDSDWVNWGTYRHMFHDKNTIGIKADPPAHLGEVMYHQKYELRNKPMEVAIAIGVEPISTLCAGATMPYGVSEVDIAGGIRGEPVELVKCETVDLAVPATAEIVIEGEMRPHERMPEGPFGEFTGYMIRGSVARPVIHVKAVTHRNNPIFTMSAIGIPVDEGHAMYSVVKSAEMLEALRANGVPVTGVCLFPEASGMLTVVAVKVRHAGVADRVANIIWESRAGFTSSLLIIVEDDVDPFDRAQVLHALATKCHPYRGIVKREHSLLMRLSPWANKHERRYGLGARAYFDCTWPVEWDESEIPKRMSFAQTYPAEVQQEALAKWQKYGY